MRALRLHDAGVLQLQTESTPKPKRGELLLQVTAVGVCGSDLHWFTRGAIGDVMLKKPLILGHEFAAEIVEGQRKGERVAVDPAIACERCEWCRHGHPNLCPNVRFAGHGKVDGALRQLIAWPENHAYTLPDSMTDADGAMLEPLGVAIHAVDLAHLKPGMSVGVFGCGPIGLLIIQIARIMGATQILATDKLVHRLDAARDYGATNTFLAEGMREQSEVWAATGSRGVDVGFEVAVGNEAVETAFASVRIGARVILVGIPDEDETHFKASVARRKGLTIKLCRRMKHTYPRAIRLVESGLVDVRSLVTHTFSLDEFDQAFEVATKRVGLKVIIEPCGAKGRSGGQDER